MVHSNLFPARLLLEVPNDSSSRTLRQIASQIFPVMCLGEQPLRLFGIRRRLRLHGSFEIVPLCGARVEFPMSIERILLVAAPYAPRPFIEEVNHIYNLVWLHHGDTVFRLGRLVSLFLSFVFLLLLWCRLGAWGGMMVWPPDAVLLNVTSVRQQGRTK